MEDYLCRFAFMTKKINTEEQFKNYETVRVLAFSKFSQFQKAGLPSRFRDFESPENPIPAGSNIVYWYHPLFFSMTSLLIEFLHENIL